VLKELITNRFDLDYLKELLNDRTEGGSEDGLFFYIQCAIIFELHNKMQATGRLRLNKSQERELSKYTMNLIQKECSDVWEVFTLQTWNDDLNEEDDSNKVS